MSCGLWAMGVSMVTRLGMHIGGGPLPRLGPLDQVSPLPTLGEGSFSALRSSVHGGSFLSPSTNREAISLPSPRLGRGQLLCKAQKRGRGPPPTSQARPFALGRALNSQAHGPKPMAQSALKRGRGPRHKRSYPTGLRIMLAMGFVLPTFLC